MGAGGQGMGSVGQAWRARHVTGVQGAQLLRGSAFKMGSARLEGEERGGENEREHT